MIMSKRPAQFASLLALLAIVPALAAAEAKPTSATPAAQLTVLPGFKVQLLHSATADEGSWICMTTDARIGVSNEVKFGVLDSLDKAVQPGLRIVQEGLAGNDQLPLGVPN